MREAVQKIDEQREAKVLCLRPPPQVAVQEKGLQHRKEDAHGLHEAEQLSDLVVGKVRAEKQKAHGKRNRAVSGETLGKEIEETREPRIQQNIERDNPVDVVTDELQLQPGRRPVDKAAAGRALRKGILPKALLAPAGPGVEIVLVEAADPELPVHKERPGDERGEQQEIAADVLFLLLFSHSSSLSWRVNARGGSDRGHFPPAVSRLQCSPLPRDSG